MIWRETGAQDFGAKVAQGVQGGTVAQWHSTLSLRLNRRALVCDISLRLNRRHNRRLNHVSITSQSCLDLGLNHGHMSHTNERSHVTPLQPSQTIKHENCPAFHFPLCSKKIEMDFGTISNCSYELNARKHTYRHQLWQLSQHHHRPQQQFYPLSSRHHRP